MLRYHNILSIFFT